MGGWVGDKHLEMKMVDRRGRTPAVEPQAKPRRGGQRLGEVHGNRQRFSSRALWPRGCVTVATDEKTKRAKT